VFCSAILFLYFNHFSRFIFAKKSCGALIFIVGNQTQQKIKFILQKTSNYDYLKTCKQTDLENKRLSNASNWYSYLQCFVFLIFWALSQYIYPQSVYICIYTSPYIHYIPYVYPLYITYYMLVHTVLHLYRLPDTYNITLQLQHRWYIHLYTLNT